MNKALIFAVALAGCVPAGTSLFFLDKKSPSAFTPEERAIFDGLDAEGPGGYCAVVNRRVAMYTAADREIAAKGLRSRGLNAKDVQTIFEPQTAYATGMTLAGLKCKTNGNAYLVNNSYHPGLGHRWQVQIGSSYVYLEGNGTPQGMRVTSWN